MIAQLTAERLPILKNYEEGRLNLLVIFGEALPAPVPSVDKFRHGPRHKVMTFCANKAKPRGYAGVDFMNMKFVHSENGYGNSRDLVFHVVEGDQFIIPSRVRLQLCEYFDGLWYGELYLSVRQGTFKSILTLGKWELDSLWSGGVTRRNCGPDDMVKSGMKIVDGISDDGAETIWDGFVSFDEYSALNKVGFVLDNSPSMLSQKFGRTALKIVDVMFGPF